MTELITGPVVDEHEETPPVKLHEGAPVGAIEPITPVILALNVIDWPPLTTVCEATIEKAGVTLGTTTEIIEEFAN